MIKIWILIKLILRWKFQRSFIYSIYIRFKWFKLTNYKPAGLKARYDFFPWKRRFKKTFFFIPSNIKKIYFFWFSVKSFYTPPSQPFIAPSVIFQNYFPKYNILLNEERILAWKLVNAHYFLRWHREFFWYKFRAKRAYEKSDTWPGIGLYPTWLRDKSLQRRPILIKFMPTWDLLKLFHALDLLIFKLPDEKKWEKKLAKKVKRNRRFNLFMDYCTFFLHLIFWYPWKLTSHLFFKYFGKFLSYWIKNISIFIRYWPAIWKNTKYHRVAWFKRFLARTFNFLLVFFLPAIISAELISYSVRTGEKPFYSEMQFDIWQNIYIDLRDDGVDYTIFIDYERIDFMYMLIGDNLLAWCYTCLIIFLFFNFIISFSPRLWAYVIANQKWILNVVLTTHHLYCIILYAALENIEFTYLYAPVIACFFAAFAYHDFETEYQFFYDPEHEQVLPTAYDETDALSLKNSNTIDDNGIATIVKGLYERPDWKSTGSSLYLMDPRNRTPDENERQLASKLNSMRVWTLGFHTARFRKRYRYIRFFAERYIQAKNLPEKDPDKFLASWLKGAISFWDNELNNPSNMFEWEYWAGQDVIEETTFTPERKAYWQDNYCDFWDFIINNSLIGGGLHSDDVQFNQEFAHLRSSKDGASLGDIGVLVRLFNNKDQDLFHVLYFDSIALQQAIFNRDVLSIFETGDLIGSKVSPVSSLIRDYISFGLKAESAMGGDPEETNAQYDFWEGYMESFVEYLQDDKTIVIGKDHDSLAVNPGAFLVKSKNKKITKYLRSKGMTKQSLPFFNYNKRSETVPYQENWHNWSDAQFYHKVTRDVRQQLMTYYLIINDVIQIGYIRFVIRKFSARKWVLQELTVLKYLNFMLPMHNFYKDYFTKNYDQDDLATMLEIWDTYRNVITKNHPIYDWERPREYFQAKAKWTEHIEKWDHLFKQAFKASKGYERWEEFKSKDVMWQELTKEYKISKQLADDYALFREEIHLITRQKRQNILPKKHYDLVVKSLILKKIVLIQRIKSLLILQETNNKYRTYTKHFRIEVQQEDYFLNRYGFFSIKAQPISILSKIMLANEFEPYFGNIFQRLIKVDFWIHIYRKIKNKIVRRPHIIDVYLNWIERKQEEKKRDERLLEEKIKKLTAEKEHLAAWKAQRIKIKDIAPYTWEVKSVFKQGVNEFVKMENSVYPEEIYEEKRRQAEKNPKKKMFKDRTRAEIMADREKKGSPVISKERLARWSFGEKSKKKK